MRSPEILMRMPFPKLPALLVCAAYGCAPVIAAEPARTGGPYVPTPQPVVDEMLRLAGVGPDDFVIDLGSGDGRIVLTAAAQYGARGMGVDIDAKLVERSNVQARQQKLDRQVRFVQRDALQTSLRGATVVTLYLLPELMHRLRDRLHAELQPGARVVSHDFIFADWRHDRSVDVNLAEKFEMPGAWLSTVYLWIVPAKVDGRWQASVSGPPGESFVFTFRQRFQYFEGEAINGVERLAVTEGRLQGAQIRFRLAQNGTTLHAFTGTANGDEMRGAVETPNGRLPWRATRVRALGR
jgi:16S rRNA G966 N2-methylase RsmD